VKPNTFLSAVLDVYILGSEQASPISLPLVGFFTDLADVPFPKCCIKGLTLSRSNAI
jgi:hypothetical protein